MQWLQTYSSPRINPVEQQAHTSGHIKPAKPSSISETTDNL